MPDGVLSSGLPADVEARLRTEVPGRGDRIIACLRTASWLLDRARGDAALSDAASGGGDAAGLRLAESAEYNLREALGAVAEGRDPAEVGLRAVRDAWTKLRLVSGTEAEAEYERAANLPGSCWPTCGRRQEQNRCRASSTRSWSTARCGVRSRRPARRLLAAGGADLFDRTRNWFVRMFTAPDAQVQAVLNLATSPWRGTEQLDQLAATIVSPQHLRLFFGRLLDPAWLLTLHNAGLVPLPSDGELWPVAAITNGLGRTHPDAVANLLHSLADDTRLVKPPPAAADFELALDHSVGPLSARPEPAVPG
jgi:hypothetical protein